MSTVLVEELPTQASVQVLIWWWIDGKASSLCSVSMHDDRISKSAILNNGYVFIFKRFVHMRASEKWHQKWSYSYWVGGFKHLMTLQSCEKVMGLSTTQCKMPMFHAHNFELAHLKKKKKNYKCIVRIHVVIGNFLVLYFRVLLVMKVLSCLYHPKAGLAGWAGWSTHYSPCCNFMCLLFHVVTL